MVKKKKGGASSRYPAPEFPFEFEPFTVLDLGYNATEYVKVRISNTSPDLKYLSPLSFEWPAVPTEVSLRMIKEAINKRHGGTASQIVLYKDKIAKTKIENQDDDMTLRDLGIKGISSGKPEDLPIVTIYYNHLVPFIDDAIVLAERDPLGSKFDINMKVYRAYQSP